MALNLGIPQSNIHIATFAQNGDPLELVMLLSEFNTASLEANQHLVAYENWLLLQQLSSDKQVVAMELINETAHTGQDVGALKIYLKSLHPGKMLLARIKTMIHTFVNFFMRVYTAIRARLQRILTNVNISKNKNKTIAELVASASDIEKNSTIPVIDTAKLSHSLATIIATYAKMVKTLHDHVEYLGVDDDWVSDLKKELGPIPKYKKENNAMLFVLHSGTVEIGTLTQAKDCSDTIDSFNTTMTRGLTICNTAVKEIERLIDKTDDLVIDSVISRASVFNGISGQVAFHMAQVCNLINSIIIPIEKSIALIEQCTKINPA